MFGSLWLRSVSACRYSTVYASRNVIFLSAISASVLGFRVALHRGLNGAVIECHFHRPGCFRCLGAGHRLARLATDHSESARKRLLRPLSRHLADESA